MVLSYGVSRKFLTRRQVSFPFYCSIPCPLRRLTIIKGIKKTIITAAPSSTPILPYNFYLRGMFSRLRRTIAAKNEARHFSTCCFARYEGLATPWYPPESRSTDRCYWFAEAVRVLHPSTVTVLSHPSCARILIHLTTWSRRDCHVCQYCFS